MFFPKFTTDFVTSYNTHKKSKSHTTDFNHVSNAFAQASIFNSTTVASKFFPILKTDNFLPSTKSFNSSNLDISRTTKAYFLTIPDNTSIITQNSSYEKAKYNTVTNSNYTNTKNITKILSSLGTTSINTANTFASSSSRIMLTLRIKATDITSLSNVNITKMLTNNSSLEFNNESTKIHFNLSSALSNSLESPSVKTSVITTTTASTENTTTNVFTIPVSTSSGQLLTTYTLGQIDQSAYLITSKLEIIFNNNISHNFKICLQR